MNESDAFDVFDTLIKNDVIDFDGTVKNESKLEELDLPEIAEPLKNEVKKIANKQNQLTFETLKEVKCVETVIEEKQSPTSKLLKLWKS